MSGITLNKDSVQKAIDIRRSLKRRFREEARREIRIGRCRIYAKQENGIFRKLSRNEALERYACTSKKAS